MDAGRVERVLTFLEVLDRFKSVYRVAYLADGSRHEGDADHAWHMCLFAMLLHGESDLTPDLRRVLELCLVHDLVEILAGDTDAYDVEGYKDKREREERAAEELFALLPEDLGLWLRGLWDEYEEAATPEARFAQAMDRLQALAQNVSGGGRAWRERGVTEELVRSRRVGPRSSTTPRCLPSSRRSCTTRGARACGAEAPMRRANLVVLTEKQRTAASRSSRQSLRGAAPPAKRAP